MFFDNNVAMQITGNPALHERIKHFEIDLFFSKLVQLSLRRTYLMSELCRPQKVVWFVEIGEFIPSLA